MTVCDFVVQSLWSQLWEECREVGRSGLEKPEHCKQSVMDDYHMNSKYQNADRNSVSKGCTNEITNTIEENIENQTKGHLYLNLYTCPCLKLCQVDLGTQLTNLVEETSGYPAIPAMGMDIAGFFRQICIENHEGKQSRRI